MSNESCPDNWLDDPGDSNGSEKKAYGDATVNDLASKTAGLNISAQPFEPGKNVHAKEFVPFGILPKLSPVDGAPTPSSSSSTFYITEQQLFRPK